MKKTQSTCHEIAGRKLVCLHCGHDRFWTRRILMNTRLASLFDFDWANREATTDVCEACGRIEWFLDKQR